MYFLIGTAVGTVVGTVVGIFIGLKIVEIRNLKDLKVLFIRYKNKIIKKELKGEILNLDAKELREEQKMEINKKLYG